VPFWPKLESLAHTLIYDFKILGDRISGKPLPASMADSITIPVLIFQGGASPPPRRNPAVALTKLLPKATARRPSCSRPSSSPSAARPEAPEAGSEAPAYGPGGW
jgi:hypothetical protein